MALFRGQFSQLKSDFAALTQTLQPPSSVFRSAGVSPALLFKAPRVGSQLPVFVRARLRPCRKRLRFNPAIHYSLHFALWDWTAAGKIDGAPVPRKLGYLANLSRPTSSERVSSAILLCVQSSL